MRVGVEREEREAAAAEEEEEEEFNDADDDNDDVSDAEFEPVGADTKEGEAEGWGTSTVEDEWLIRGAGDVGVDGGG